MGYKQAQMELMIYLFFGLNCKTFLFIATKHY